MTMLWFIWLFNPTTEQITSFLCTLINGFQEKLKIFFFLYDGDENKSFLFALFCYHKNHGQASTSDSNLLHEGIVDLPSLLIYTGKRKHSKRVLEQIFIMFFSSPHAFLFVNTRVNSLYLFLSYSSLFSMLGIKFGTLYVVDKVSNIGNIYTPIPLAYSQIILSNKTYISRSRICL